MTAAVVVEPWTGAEQHSVPLGAVQVFAPAISTTTASAVITGGALAYHPNAMGDDAIAAPLWWQQLSSRGIS